VHLVGFIIRIFHDARLSERQICIVICGLCGSALFFHIMSLTARFSGGKKITEHNMRVFIFSVTFV